MQNKKWRVELSKESLKYLKKLDKPTAQRVLKSLEELESCRVEPGLAGVKPGDRFQFLRQGYFCVDSDSTPEKLVFNLTVPLRDTWAKIERAQKKS